ncbi:4735_t:CDS:2, partial [Scutellospora calospora]
MLQSIAILTDNIPPSPTSVIHQHTCQKCQQPIAFAETSTSTSIYTTSSTFPMNYAATRKNLLTTFQQNQTNPLISSNTLTTALPITQLEITCSTLTVSIPTNNTSSNMEID